MSWVLFGSQDIQVFNNELRSKEDIDPCFKYASRVQTLFPIWVYFQSWESPFFSLKNRRNLEVKEAYPNGYFGLKLNFSYGFCFRMQENHSIILITRLCVTLNWILKEKNSNHSVRGVQVVVITWFDQSEITSRRLKGIVSTIIIQAKIRLPPTFKRLGNWNLC